MTAHRLTITVAVDEDDRDWYTFTTNPVQVSRQQADVLERELEGETQGVIFAGIDEAFATVLFSADIENLTEAWIETIYTIGKTLGFELDSIDVVLQDDPEARIQPLRKIFDEYYQLPEPIPLHARR